MEWAELQALLQMGRIAAHMLTQGQQQSTKRATSLGWLLAELEG